MTVIRFLALVALLSMSSFVLSGCSVGNPATIAPGTGLVPEVSPLAPQPATLAPVRKPVQLTILHTNDTRGFVDPCG